MPVLPLALPALKADSIPATPSVAAQQQVDYKLGELAVVVPTKHAYSGGVYEFDPETLGLNSIPYKLLDLPFILFGVMFSHIESMVIECIGGSSKYMGFAAGHYLLNNIPPDNHSAWKAIKRVGNPDGTPQFIMAHNAQQITQAAMCRFTYRVGEDGFPRPAHEGVNIHIIENLVDLTPS